MARLSKHLPQHVYNIREFGDIDKAISPELDNLDKFSKEVEDNQFIQTARDRGLTRYEKMFKLPTDNDIEIRRVNVLNLYNTKANYTHRWLRQYLTTLVGESEYLVLLNGFSLTVSISMGKAHLRDKIFEDLRNKIPANIALNVNLLASHDTNIYTGFIHRTMDKFNY